MIKDEKEDIRLIKLKCGIEVWVDFNLKKKCECGKEILFGRTKRNRYMPISLVGLAEWDTHFVDCSLVDKFRKDK